MRPRVRPPFCWRSNKRTGKQRWKVDWPKGLRSYSTPAVVPGAAGDELVISSSANIDAYNPKTGEWLWKTGEANEFPVPFPTHHDGITYAISGPHRNGSYMAIKSGGRGDITKTHVAWRVAAGGPHVASPLYYEGLLYLTHENGVVTCVDAKTGERIWQGRTSGLFTASPVGADGRSTPSARPARRSCSRPAARSRSWRKRARRTADGVARDLEGPDLPAQRLPSDRDWRCRASIGAHKILRALCSRT